MGIKLNQFMFMRKTIIEHLMLKAVYMLIIPLIMFVNVTNKSNLVGQRKYWALLSKYSALRGLRRH